MEKIVRLKDIAERAHVSTVTVSKALSGQKGVSEEMRKVIEDLAAEMGYQPKTKERGIRVSYNIGILLSNRFFDKFNSFYGNVQSLITNEASKMECFTTMEVITDEMEEAHVLPNIIESKRVDGYIVLGRMEEDYLNYLDESTDIPYVYVDFVIPQENRDSIISDSFYGTYLLTNYLFNKGHRKIAYVGTVLSTSSITDRYLGYRKSMMEHGIDVPEEWIIPDRDSVTGFMDAERFFQLPEKMPTAFVCNCDLAASYLVRKLNVMGLDCPEDVSVVGFDNMVYPGITEHSFTTFEVDTKEMARKAVRNLIHKISREYYQRGITIVTGRMIERESVRDLR